jgi:hypothetical protein
LSLQDRSVRPVALLRSFLPTDESAGGSALSDDAPSTGSAGERHRQTVDFFTPVVDDPRLFGQIAAANALSDVYAMRGRPVLALALAAFPMTVLPSEVLEEILRGGAEKVAEAGAVIGGGHSIDHDIPLYGLAVTGWRVEITRNAGASQGRSCSRSRWESGDGLRRAADTLRRRECGAPRRKLSRAALGGRAVMTTLSRAPSRRWTVTSTRRPT